MVLKLNFSRLNRIVKNIGVADLKLLEVSKIERGFVKKFLSLQFHLLITYKKKDLKLNIYVPSRHMHPKILKGSN